jgi:hypothetical protein
MTTMVTKLLAQKQELLQRLEEDPGPHEHDEIERLLAKIHTALNLLDELSRGKPAKLRGLC